MEINRDGLESAFSKQDLQNNVPQTNDGNSAPMISKGEEIGFHKGALNTLVNERNELFRMIQNVEAVMQAHIKRLEQLGIKVPIAKN
jgi:predicted site-specific integrase-resolvase